LLAAPYTQSSTLRMPSGLTSTTSATRAATLSDPNNPLSLVSQTDTTVLNGRTWTTSYGAGTRQETTTSPAGRVTRRWIDAQGRTTRLEAPGRAPVTYSYDSRGRLASIVEGTAPDTRTTSLTYNAQGYVS
jgi:YD repeat-containing protein